VFDDIIREDEKIRDKKLEIENQKAAYRNNEAVLAARNYELWMLELERDKLDNSIKSLIDRQKQSENTLKEVQGQRAGIQANSRELENEIRRYEALIDTLNREIGDRDPVGKGKRKAQNEKKAKVPITSSGEISRSAKERELAVKSLDSVEDKWNKRLTKVAHEAQKLVSPSEVEQEQRAEIDWLLKEIDAASKRTIDLQLKLDTLKA